MKTMVTEGWRRDIPSKHFRDEVGNIWWLSEFKGRAGGRRLE